MRQLKTRAWARGRLYLLGLTVLFVVSGPLYCTGSSATPTPTATLSPALSPTSSPVESPTPAPTQPGTEPSTPTTEPGATETPGPATTPSPTTSGPGATATAAVIPTASPVPAASPPADTAPPQATPAAAQPTSTPIPTSTVTGARPSTLEVRVTDDPPPKGVSRVEVTVGDVEVNMASADTEGGWSVVATGPKTFDLMQVMGVEELLGTADLIPGQYNQVRLEVKRSRLPLRGRIYRRGYPVASYGSWVDST